MLTRYFAAARERDWAWDRDCDAWVSADSGYCECSGNLTTQRLSRSASANLNLSVVSTLQQKVHTCACRTTCGRHIPFTCVAECDKLNDEPNAALPLPHNISCPLSGEFKISFTKQPCDLHQYCVGVMFFCGRSDLRTCSVLVISHTSSLAAKIMQSICSLLRVGAAEARLMQQVSTATQLPEWRGNTKNLDAQAAVLWAQVMTAVQVSGYNLVLPPEARGASKDWVRDGVRMQRYVASSACTCSVEHYGDDCRHALPDRKQLGTQVSHHNMISLTHGRMHNITCWA